MDGPVGVTSILNPEIKSGYNSKGAKWVMARVRLSNGKEANIFQPIDIGDAVESYDNKGYMNWRKISAANDRPAQTAPSARPPQVDNSQLDRIEKQLSIVQEGINKLLGVGDGAEED